MCSKRHTQHMTLLDFAESCGKVHKSLGPRARPPIESGLPLSDPQGRGSASVAVVAPSWGGLVATSALVDTTIAETAEHTQSPKELPGRLMRWSDYCDFLNQPK